MFIGHFAIAYLIWKFVPGIPVLIPLIGVAFPDIFWPILVLMGVEKVEFDKSKPLQKDIVFESYPLSHSLVLTTIIAFIIGLILALILNNLLIAPVFALASASHWILDIIVHNKDLPLLGFSNRDVKVGFGLWRRGPLAFVIEYIFYAVISILVVPVASLLPILVLGAIFHLININSFFGFKKENITGSSKSYAVITLIGFTVFIFFAQLFLS